MICAENAGYHFAREKQSETLRRMADIHVKISSAKIIDDLNLPKDEVTIGMKVRYSRGRLSKRRLSSTALVGAEESDPAAGKISVHAPIAQGLLGHKVNEDFHRPARRNDQV